MFSTKPFNSILDLLKAFPDEQSCIDHLEYLRWNGNVISPYNVNSKVYKCKGNKYKCKATNQYFNVRTNTIFEGTKMPLQQWILAIYLFTSHKRGISSYQLASDLSISQKSAWFLLSRLRYAMAQSSFWVAVGEEMQVDETFVGGKNKNRHADKKVKNSQGRSFKDKTPVFGALTPNKTEVDEHGEMIKMEVSKVYAIAVKDTKSESIKPIIAQIAEHGSIIVSDEWTAYTGLNKNYSHYVVDHERKEYVNEGGYTTNGIENFWGHFKRGIDGTYYKRMNKKHLQKYVDEFVFRFNNRDITTSARVNVFLQATEGKRLTFKTLTAKDGTI